MKKFFTLLIATIALFIGCNKEEDQSYTLSFSSDIPLMVDDIATISISTTYKEPDTLIIPVIFGGDAEKGVDYEISSDHFVIGGDNPVTTIQVKSLILGANKSITARIEAPEGFKLGNFPLIDFKTAKKSMYFSFKFDMQVLISKTNLTIEVLDEKGLPKDVDQDTEIEIQVDDRLSTAKLGENFVFDIDPDLLDEDMSLESNPIQKVVIKAGTNAADIPIKISLADKDKNTAAFRIVEKNSIGLGQYAIEEVKIVGVKEFMKGKWNIKSIYTDTKWFNKTWGGMLTSKDFEFFPKFNPADSFTIDEKAETFTPDFKSEFKNYFIGVSNIEEASPDYYPTDYDTGKVTNLRYSSENLADVFFVDRFLFDNINRDFDPDSVSDDKLGVVGFEYVDDETMKMYILDYTPKRILNSLISDYYNPFAEIEEGVKKDRPVSAGDGATIIAFFTKAK